MSERKTIVVPLDDNQKADPDPIVKRFVPYEEAVAYVKRSRGKTLFVYAGQFARDYDQRGTAVGNVRGREIGGHIIVPRREILRFLENAYFPKAREECYVTLSESKRCLFVGGSI